MAGTHMPPACLSCASFVHTCCGNVLRYDKSDMKDWEPRTALQSRPTFRRFWVVPFFRNGRECPRSWPYGLQAQFGYGGERCPCREFSVKPLSTRSQESQQRGGTPPLCIARCLVDVRNARRFERALASRDMTVPTGQSNKPAISSYDNASNSRSKMISRQFTDSA